MRKRYAYLASLAIHGVAFWSLAVAGQTFFPAEFAVRSGDAVGGLSRASRAGSLVATLETQSVTTPVETNFTVPSEPTPLPERSLASPTVPPAAASAPTPADLDHRGAAPSLATRKTRHRPDRMIAFAELPALESVEVSPTDVATIETDPQSSPVLTVPHLTTDAAASESPPMPQRVALAEGPRSFAAGPVTGLTEPGDSDVNAINANTPQGAQYDHLPKGLFANREPVYPEELRRRNIGGRVLLKVVISADGTVEEVTVDKTSGEPLLDESAVKAVRTWRFQPARKGNAPVRSTVRLPVSFRVGNAG